MLGAWARGACLGAAVVILQGILPGWAGLPGAGAQLRSPAGADGEALLARTGGEARAARPRGDSPLLAGPIDAETYVVGPGDVFGLVIPGVLDGGVTLVVDAEGGLILPGSVGRVEIAGMSLADAREAVGQALAGIIRAREFALSLEEPRRFKVYVSGAVVTPGTYSADAVTRLSEVIERAGGLARRGSERQILIERADGSQVTADLALFSALGSQAANPLLAGGDVVRVPVRTGEIAVFGGVASPGVYELGVDETAGSALALAGGVVPGARLDQATLSRVEPGQSLRRVIPLDLELEDVRSEPLAAGDALVVPITEEDRRAVNEVEVTGEVAFPGRYPIKPGTDTVADLLARAGGLTPHANRDAMLVWRAAPGSADLASQPADAAGSRGGGSLPGSGVAVGFGDLPYITREAELLDRSETGREVRLVDGEEPLGDATRLYDGDRLHVPRAEARVRVDGRVRRPGFVPFVEGRTVADYVELAGGFDQRADRNRVLVQRAGRGGFEAARDGAPVADGDTIWVPERAPRGWWATTREIAAFAAQLATVAIIIDQVVGP
jgi:protein involved in polysaccharide export with SLBB domain